jgi:hypothetical protein
MDSASANRWLHRLLQAMILVIILGLMAALVVPRLL